MKIDQIWYTYPWGRALQLADSSKVFNLRGLTYIQISVQNPLNNTSANFAPLTGFGMIPAGFGPP